MQPYALGRSSAKKVPSRCKLGATYSLCDTQTYPDDALLNTRDPRAGHVEFAHICDKTQPWQFQKIRVSPRKLASTARQRREQCDIVLLLLVVVVIDVLLT